MTTLSVKTFSDYMQAACRAARLENSGRKTRRRIKRIAPDRDRTCDLRFRKPFAQNQKPLNLAENLEAENSSAELALKIEPKTAPDSAIADEDLRQLIDRWPSLAPAIRRGILAMVKS